MRSSHFRLSRDLSAAVGASLTAFMYSSAAAMACSKASRPEEWVILASVSCRIVSHHGWHGGEGRGPGRVAVVVYAKDSLWPWPP